MLLFPNKYKLTSMINCVYTAIKLYDATILHD